MNFLLKFTYRCRDANQEGDKRACKMFIITLLRFFFSIFGRHKTIYIVKKNMTMYFTFYTQQLL